MAKGQGFTAEEWPTVEAMRGKAVCRCHGGKGGAPKGKANGAWRHGHYAGDALTVRQAIAALNRLARATVDEFD